MIPLVWLGVLTALGVAAFKVVSAYLDHHGTTNAPTLSEACSSNSTCPINIGTPSPTNQPPVAGKASSLTYRWCIEVKDGYTAGGIAKAITGDARRYLELLAANPTIPRVTDPTTGEVNFKWPEKCTGLRVLLPFSWNIWMDQTGKARGITLPFPPFDLAAFAAYPVAVNTIVEGRMPDLVKGGWV